MSSLKPDVLSIQFGERCIQINSSNEAVLKRLALHLHHCQGNDYPLTAVYHIHTTANNQWQLQRDSDIVHTSSTIHELFEFLMHDSLTQLIAITEKHLVFHAGAVAHKHQGIILCGQSGQGKSTLTALLLQQGFDYVTDEAIVIPHELQHIKGFARSLVLKAGSQFAWQHLTNAGNSTELEYFPDGKVWVPAALLGAKRIHTTAVPTILLFPQYNPALTSLNIHPLSIAETVFQLMQHLVNARNLPQHGLTAVRQLAQQCPAYSLQYRDATTVAHWAREQLSVISEQ